ncbi:MAG: hypothetical protein OQL20_10220 [Sedimenticola sp.]|nr:hypothetical protein [Sedimenticola sp.]
MLTFIVSLLPFGLNYGLASIVDGNASASNVHNSMMACAERGHVDGCEKLSHDVPLHDDCCSDHCDTSSGSQLCVGTEYPIDLPSGHLFQTATSTWITGPVPPALLRPPQLHT